jgi:hypothetical protein
MAMDKDMDKDKDNRLPLSMLAPDRVFKVRAAANVLCVVARRLRSPFLLPVRHHIPTLATYQAPKTDLHRM